MSHKPRESNILVGVDGSEGAARAVDWAVDYVKRNGGVLELINVWQMPTYYAFPLALPSFEPRADAEQLLAKTAEGVDLPKAELKLTAVAGTAAHRLVEATKHADLLVVGSRGLGGFSGMVLGSVGAHCVHHAHCPVVVVRPHESDKPIPAQRERISETTHNAS